MKRIRYMLNGNPVEIGWNESTEEIAKREADNGEYKIFDDGQPAPFPNPSDNLAERVTAVESDVASLTAAIEKGLAL